jgi:hypothetical protein
MNPANLEVNTMTSTMTMSTQFSYGYDPYAEPEAVAEFAAELVKFRQIAEAAGLEIDDNSDRDIELRVVVEDQDAALVLLNQLLDAGVMVQSTVLDGTAESELARALEAIYAAHALEPQVDGRDLPPDQEAERDRVVAEMVQFRQFKDALITSGIPIRALVDDLGPGWVDMFAVHPEVGVNCLISLDAGGQIWGYDCHWAMLVRVKAADGREGWASGESSPSDVDLDDGSHLDIYHDREAFLALHLAPLPYPSAPPPVGQQTVSVTIPVTFALTGSAAQTEQVIAEALHNLAGQVLGHGAQLARVRDVKISIGGVPVLSDSERMRAEYETGLKT